MAARSKRKVTRRISAKARQVLEYAEERAATAADWAELSNALFGPSGKASELFSTEPERTAFCRTKEYERILALMDKLPSPPVNGSVELVVATNGAIVRR